MRAERDVVVGQVRRQGWHKVGFGLYRRDECGRAEADLVAWQQILPESGCLTHLTGAVVHGLWLPPLPRDLPVFVSMASSESRPKRSELLVMRHTKPISSVWRDGLRVATVDECLLTCARDLSLLDLVVLGDSALHAGLTSPEVLSRSAARRRWGAVTLQNAIGWMDRRSESPWESLLRVFHRSCGIPVVPQHEVRHQGRFVARGDLWIVGSRMLHEYDGAVHRDAETHRADLDRDRRLLAADWRRRGYTAADLLGRPERILAEADDTLGRRHRVERLDPWLRMVDESLFAAAGMERFVTRLGRHKWPLPAPDSGLSA
jgi:hypothetical protein